VCPSCGAKQRVRREFANLPQFKEPGVNMVPFIIGIGIVIFCFVAAANQSWIGQLMTRKPQAEDPLARVSPLEARSAVENKIAEGLQAVGAKATFKWTAAGAEADKSASKPVELAVDTSLQDPNSHKAIIDNVKDYMLRANMTTLTMTDAKSHATWTYNVPAPPPSDDAAASPDNAATTESPASQQ